MYIYMYISFSFSVSPFPSITYLVVSKRLRGRTYIHTYIHAYTYLVVSKRLRGRTYIHTYTHTYTYLVVSKRLRGRTYIHTHIHTPTWSLVRGSGDVRCELLSEDPFDSEFVRPALIGRAHVSAPGVGERAVWGDVIVV